MSVGESEMNIGCNSAQREAMLGIVAPPEMVFRKEYNRLKSTHECFRPELPSFLLQMSARRATWSQKNPAMTCRSKCRGLTNQYDFSIGSPLPASDLRNELMGEPEPITEPKEIATP